MTDPQHPSLIEGFLDFLQRSPTPFHATANAVAALQQRGFQLLRESDSWQLEQGGRYIVTRNDSALLAFTLPAGTEGAVTSGFHLAGAHTDSPCLKVKPSPELPRFGCFQLGVEVYGGVLLNPWFDRDLSLAGRVTYVDGSGQLGSTLLDFARPVAVIPSLAIHLDRGVNENRSINAQLHLPPVLSVSGEEAQLSFRDILLAELKRAQPDSPAAEILDYEMALYDAQPPARTGLAGELISSARLDNLLSCYVGLQALLQADGSRAAMIVLTDHE
ncbi:MAG: M18 family aminopeptidase, partial [Spongiibacteraceae bacterium]|nr:M18 family aminopeptidase [Spongiibacteraceae bacterium]